MPDDDFDQNLQDLLNSSSTTVDKDELELSEKERKDEINKLKKQLNKLKDMEDEEFVRKTLKTLTVKGQSILAVMQDEIESAPDSRSVEVAAKLISSINESLQNLIEVKQKNRELDIKEKKVDSGGNEIHGTQQNIYFQGSFSELVKKVDQEQEVVDAEIVEDDKKQIEEGDKDQQGDEEETE